MDEPYENIVYGEWTEVGSGRVRYLSPEERLLRFVARLLSNIEFDLLYLNSIYSITYSVPALLLRSLGLLEKPFLVAPKGELAPSAVAKKAWKKRPYLYLIDKTGLYDDVFWKASNSEEADQIRKWFGENQKIGVAPDLPQFPAEDRLKYEPEPSGILQAVFLSRIHPIKNLDYLLECLNRVNGEVTLDIYGPVDDQNYWNECKKLIRESSEHLQVDYRGTVPPTEVVEVMAGYDLFALPTQGENFGHAIFEALASGTPVLISDQTPWQGLSEAKAGWSVDLESTKTMVGRLQKCVEADKNQRLEWSEAARAYAASESTVGEAVDRNRVLFRNILDGHSHVSGEAG
jgi:glycosyltransferase involved in cell wall biosynthesis